METTTLGELIQGRKIEAEMKQCLYIVRDGKEILYIGKTARATLHNRFRGHLGLAHFPAQLKFDVALREAGKSADYWMVDVLQQEDWNAIFQAEGLSLRYKLNTAESALIKHYKPKYNLTSHPDHPHPLPWVKDQTQTMKKS